MKARRQGGQILAYVAIVVPLLLLPVAAYSVEATRIAAVQARLQSVAATAAEDAAQQIDEPGFRAGGPLQPDPGAADAVVRAEVQALEPAAAVDSLATSGSGVSLSLSESVPLLFGGILGPAGVTVHARAAARLRAGY